MNHIAPKVLTKVLPGPLGELKQENCRALLIPASPTAALFQGWSCPQDHPRCAKDVHSMVEHRRGWAVSRPREGVLLATMGSGTGDVSSPDRRGPTLHVRLLGGVDLRLDDTPVPPLDSGRAESLLAYLLLHRDAPQQRQGLAFLLWPESTEAQARTNLRHVLHNLRRALPDADRFIDVRPRTLQWRPDAPWWLDVAAFEQAVTGDRLEDAVHTYTGELLEGSYDEWLLEERQRLAHLHVDALERLARTLGEQRRWREAIGYAERLIRADPLREDVYRLLIRLCDVAGDRGRALRVYHVCAATLQRELARRRALGVDTRGIRGVAAGGAPSAAAGSRARVVHQAGGPSPPGTTRQPPACRAVGGAGAAGRTVARCGGRRSTPRAGDR